MRRGLPTILMLVVIAGALGFWAWTYATDKVSHSPSIATAPASMPSATFRVMTANIRMATDVDKENAWPKRRAALVKTLLKYGPDFIGCQEVTPAQGAYLTKELATWYDHYPRAGVGGTAAGSQKTGGGQLLGTVTETFASLNTLFFRADRFDIIDGEAGLVLPDELQGQADENTFYTLGIFKEKDAFREAGHNVETLIVVDTHLRHREAFATKCATRIREKIGAMIQKYPSSQVLIMGDINHDRNSTVYAALQGAATSADHAGALADSFDYSKKALREPWGTYHAFTGKPQRDLPTDLIFHSGDLLVKETTVVRDQDENGRFPSDHFFFLVEFRKK